MIFSGRLGKPAVSFTEKEENQVDVCGRSTKTGSDIPLWISQALLPWFSS